MQYNCINILIKPVFLCLVISRVELIRKDKEKFRSARKIPPSGKQALIYYTRKNAQVVTDLQTSCNEVVNLSRYRMYSHCLFPVVVSSLEQVVITLLQG